MLHFPDSLPLPEHFTSFGRTTSPCDLATLSTISHFLSRPRSPLSPHSREQSDQELHDVHSNTEGGHSSRLQNKTDVDGPGQGRSSSVESIRDFPFRLLGTTHCRDLFVIPPPQVWVHSDHSPQAVHSAHLESKHPSAISDFPPPHGFSSAVKIVLKGDENYGK